MFTLVWCTIERRMTEAERPELTTFNVREAYVYSPIPPAGTVGHRYRAPGAAGFCVAAVLAEALLCRAANWDVDHWAQTVTIRVITAGDNCCVRLTDMESGALAVCYVGSAGPAAALSHALLQDRPLQSALSLRTRRC